MNFKDKLNADFEKVFLNKDEFADVILIDGIEVNGLFEENSGEYEEAITTIRIASSSSVSETSEVVVRGRTYSVISIKPPEYGEKIVVLGSPL